MVLRKAFLINSNVEEPSRISLEPALVRRFVIATWLKITQLPFVAFNILDSHFRERDRKARFPCMGASQQS